MQYKHGGEVLNLDLRDLTKLVEFDKTRRVMKDLYKTRMFNIVLVCLETGQEIPPHSPPYDVCVYVIDGHGTFTVGNKQAELRAGSMVFVPANVTRGIKSIQRLSFLGIQEAH